MEKTERRNLIQGIIGKDRIGSILKKDSRV
jgi:hypothetical protein